MSNHRFERLDYVKIVGGPHAGEKGRIWELFDAKHYGVKVLTGPEKDQQGTFVAREDHLEADEVPQEQPAKEQGLIERLFIRATIRRLIPNRKSTQEGKEDRLAALLDEAGSALVQCLWALKPFAQCIEQISDEEDDEEWAKFRLLIKDYRYAAKVFRELHPRTTIPAWSIHRSSPARGGSGGSRGPP